MAEGTDFKSESGHWYDHDGSPQYTIVGANGKRRNTTLRDARKEKFVPSVTAILDMAAKPALENWKINTALVTMLNLSQEEDESNDDFISRCRRDSRDIASTAADRGTEIHAMIENGFAGGEDNKIYKDIKTFLDVTYPDQTWIAEDSFCSDLGYGGKIDLYSKSGIFVDFKTKDNLEGKKASSLAFDNYGMQLSAYAQGCGFTDDAERVSIFVDRADTDVILMHVWDKDTHAKHRDMFNSLLTYWKLMKNYDSSFEK